MYVGQQSNTPLNLYNLCCTVPLTYIMQLVLHWLSCSTGTTGQSPVSRAPEQKSSRKGCWVAASKPPCSHVVASSHNTVPPEVFYLCVNELLIRSWCFIYLQTHTTRFRPKGRRYQLVDSAGILCFTAQGTHQYLDRSEILENL